jgi:hypothetical protein
LPENIYPPTDFTNELKPSDPVGRVAFSVFWRLVLKPFISFYSFNSMNEIKRIYFADLQRYNYCKAGSCPLSLHRRSRRERWPNGL